MSGQINVDLREERLVPVCHIFSSVKLVGLLEVIVLEPGELCLNGCSD